MSSDIAISVKNLTKTYRIFGHPGDRIKQAFTFGQLRFYKEFTALQDVSFEIKKGETVGIIGRNGSGKSTLLQLICGILKPTSGTVKVNERVSALLELGAGFNPEFTGRENVYFQGAIMGFSKAQMEERFAGIAAFADIGEFIDQPVRIYSSGMFVRLAFAVAVNVNPEILVVDEALSVGDEGFQRKCYSFIRAIKSKGITIILVSHSAADILEICDRVILLDKGEELASGCPKPILDHYRKLVCAPPEKIANVVANIRSAGVNQIDLQGAEDDFDTLAFDPSLTPISKVTYESRGAKIQNPTIVDSQGQSVNLLVRGGKYSYRYSVQFDEDVRQVRFAMMIKTKTGYELGGMTSHPLGGSIEEMTRGTRMTVDFPFCCCLLPGRYFLNSGVLGIVKGEEVFLHRVIDILAFQVQPEMGLVAGGIIDFSMPDGQIKISACIEADPRSV